MPINVDPLQGIMINQYHTAILLSLFVGHFFVPTYEYVDGDLIHELTAI